MTGSAETFAIVSTQPICHDPARHHQHPWPLPDPSKPDWQIEQEQHEAAVQQARERIAAGVHSIRGLRKQSGYRLERNEIRSLLWEQAPEYMRHVDAEWQRVWREIIEPRWEYYQQRGQRAEERRQERIRLERECRLRARQRYEMLTLDQHVRSVLGRQ